MKSYYLHAPITPSLIHTFLDSSLTYPLIKSGPPLEERAVLTIGIQNGNPISVEFDLIGLPCNSERDENSVLKPPQNRPTVTI